MKREDLIALECWLELSTEQINMSSAYAISGIFQKAHAAIRDLLPSTKALKEILSREMTDQKAVNEYGGFILDDDLRAQAKAAIDRAES